MFPVSASVAPSRYGAPASYPVSGYMSTGPDEFIRQFSVRMGQLTDPVLREVLDPLVLDAREFAGTSPNAGQRIIGAVEYALLRAPPNKKYPICIFIDALCRSQSLFPFKVHFAPNLEKVFSSAFVEADKIGKEKMVRLLNIWKKGNRGMYLFDQLLLDRIRARCDPDYEGDPIEALPEPRFASSVSAPPAPHPGYSTSYSATTAPPAFVPPPTTVYPPRPPPAPAMIQPPVIPLQPQQEQMMFARAAELLRNLFAQMNVPESQQMPLADIHRANPDLYQQIMAQAHRDIISNTAASAPMQTSIHLPLPSHSAPSLTPPPSHPTPPAANSLTLFTLNAQNALDRSNIPYFVSLLEMETKPISAKSKRNKRIAELSAEGSVSARAWYLDDAEWKSGKASTSEVAFKLFADSTAGSKISGSSSVIAGEAHRGGGADALIGGSSSVPKDDSQTRCALSGEEFETFWNSEEEMWMYKDTVRPDPSGPIYKTHAWLAQRRGREDDTGERKRTRFS